MIGIRDIHHDKEKFLNMYCRAAIAHFYRE